MEGVVSSYTGSYLKFFLDGHPHQYLVTMVAWLEMIRSIRNIILISQTEISLYLGTVIMEE